MESNSSKVEFLYLDEEDMIKAGVLDAGRCVDVMQEVTCLMSQGDYLMGGKGHNEHGIQLIFPKKSEIDNFPLEDSPDRRFMSMPAYLGGRFHMAGEKWYGSNGRNKDKGLPRSILMVTLNDIESGKPLAYMSANLLSAMRTGAMPGLVARHLAKKGSKVLALLGAGVVNKACLMAYMSQIKSIETIKIKGSSKTSKTATKLADFARENYPGKEVIICDTLEEAIRESDIIGEAVSPIGKQWPTIEKDWIKPGALIISSGTMDIDLDFMAQKIVKVVDNIDMYKEYIAVYQEYDKDGKFVSIGNPGMNFINLANEGKIQESEIQCLGNIIMGEDKGRTNDDEIILAVVGGMPVQDVAWGHDCYSNALKKDIGTKLKVWDSPFFA